MEIAPMAPAPGPSFGGVRSTPGGKAGGGHEGPPPGGGRPDGAFIRLPMLGIVGMPILAIIASAAAFGSPDSPGMSFASIPGSPSPGPGGSESPGSPAFGSGRPGSRGALLASPPAAGPLSPSSPGIAFAMSPGNFGRLRLPRPPSPCAGLVPGKRPGSDAPDIAPGNVIPAGSVMPAGRAGLMPCSNAAMLAGAVPPARPGIAPPPGNVRPLRRPPGNGPVPAAPGRPGLGAARPGSWGSDGMPGSLAAGAEPTSFCNASACDAASPGCGCVRGRLGMVVWSLRKRTPARLRSESVSVTPSARL
mmetsp:Transcript_112476/g.318209  ORF Transcript_112476/g.318209 Transcript_112476/m.318209 type:complete len:305 (-) Transcript_112476:795-1709(-)